MCNSDDLSSHMEVFINLFKQKFEKNGGKIYLPKTKEELVGIMKEYLTTGLDEKINNIEDNCEK